VISKRRLVNPRLPPPRKTFSKLPRKVKQVVKPRNDEDILL
jgi:hypothetical protein